MKLSENFKSSANRAFKTAADPYFVGLVAVFAACTYPFSETLPIAALAAPLVYASLGATYRAASYGLQLSGR